MPGCFGEESSFQVFSRQMPPLSHRSGGARPRLGLALIFTGLLLGFFLVSGPASAAEVEAANALSDQVSFIKLCSWGSPETVRLALELGADPNKAPLNMDTVLSPLGAAARSRQDSADKVKLLLEAGADPRGRENLDGMTALHIAAMKGNRASAELLLRSGSEVNARDDQGLPPLKLALVMAPDRPAGEEAAMIKLLLEAGADIRWKSPNGDSIFLTAARYARAETLGLLLDAGAEVNETLADGLSPLMEAARSNPDPQAVRLLLDRGADPFQRDSRGDDALRYARDNPGPQAEAIKEMIRQRMKDDPSRTP